MDESISSRRNAPHIAKIEQFGSRIRTASSNISEDCDFEKISSTVSGIIIDITSLYSNHDMNLVVDKLKESQMYLDDKRITESQDKLFEASGWCKLYAKFLESN